MTLDLFADMNPEEGAPSGGEGGRPGPVTDEAGAEASAGSAKQKSGGLRSLSSFGSLPEAPFIRRRASLASSSRADSAAAMQRDPSGVAFKAVLEGAMHFDFTDIALVAPLADLLSRAPRR